MQNRSTFFTRHPQIERFIDRQFGKGVSFREIADEIDKKFHESISHQSIKNYVDRRGLITRAVIEGNEDLKEKIKNDAIDTMKELKKIRERLWEMIEEFDDKGSVKLGAINTLIRLLELNEKKLGTIVNINNKTISNTFINKVDMGIQITKQLDELRRDGYISLIRTLPTARMLSPEDR